MEKCGVFCPKPPGSVAEGRDKMPDKAPWVITHLGDGVAEASHSLPVAQLWEAMSRPVLQPFAKVQLVHNPRPVEQGIQH